MKRKIQYIISLSLILFVVSLSFFAHHSRVNSYGIITGVKDTLSNPQLSYFGRINTGTSGDSIIKIITNNVGWTVPSLTANNLFVGDTIAIGTTGAGVGTSGPLTIYTIRDIGDTASILLNTGLGQSNAFSGASVIATRSSIHSIAFTTTGNITGSFWQVLIKATSRVGETQNDGIPDQQGFDLGQDVGGTTTGLGTRLKVADVSCPNFLTGGVGSTLAYSIGITTVNGSTYHAITCYQGIGGTAVNGVGYTITIGRDLSTGSQLINPSPSTSSHTEGNADVYTFLLRHLDASQAVQDQTQGKIAVVEAVRVTATVDPTLSFTIGTTNATQVGGTACGTTIAPNGNATTSDSVAFGSIILNQANDLAQILSAVTNADAGYVVTAYQESVMHSVANGTTLPNTTCGGSCNMTTSAAWSAPYTTSGFGYTLQNLNVGTSIFNYQSGYRPFGIGYANAQQVMKNINTPAAIEQAYVCYRITASTYQEANNYEAKLVYTATATF